MKNGKPIVVPFLSLRNISTAEDISAGRKVLTGYLPASSVLALPTNENVRGYLVDAEGKQRRKLSAVHKAIKDTLKNRPNLFSVLSGGIVIVAREMESDEKEKAMELVKASIINGAQTQGVMNDFRQEGNSLEGVAIRFELIITDEEELIADITIARNFQNDVKNLSIVGTRGYLEELNKHFQKKHPELRLQTSETEWPADDNDYVPTEKILQVIAALLPDSLWYKSKELNRAYTYNSKATCLKDFDMIYRQANRISNDPEETFEDQEKFKTVYQFYLDIVGQAYDLYTKWQSNQAFQSCGLRCIERDGKEIIEVPDGLVFPIIAALSEFAVKTDKGWKIKSPDIGNELVAAAKTAYMEIAKSRPDVMGKTKACYSQVQQVAAMYKKFSKQPAA